MKRHINFLVIAGLSLWAIVSQASLTDHGNGMIYDDNKNLTWLQDANFAKTTNFDGDGRFSWAAANAWAGQLTVDGLSGWRLPQLNDGPACIGANCANSELAHQFYSELGGHAEADLALIHSSNYDLFKNLQPSVYWMKDEQDIGFMKLGWGFVYGGGVLGGYQNLYNENSEFHAWAVHAGDVAAINGHIPPAGIPVPAAVWLFGSGLIALVGSTRKRARGGLTLLGSLK